MTEIFVTSCFVAASTLKYPFDIALDIIIYVCLLNPEEGRKLYSISISSVSIESSIAHENA